MCNLKYKWDYSLSGSFKWSSCHTTVRCLSHVRKSYLEDINDEREFPFWCWIDDDSCLFNVRFISIEWLFQRLSLFFSHILITHINHTHKRKHKIQIVGLAYEWLQRSNEDESNSQLESLPTVAFYFNVSNNYTYSSNEREPSKIYELGFFFLSVLLL